jgi:hypothetical protein
MLPIPAVALYRQATYKQTDVAWGVEFARSCVQAAGE